MLVAKAIAEVLKRENVKFIIGYPVNPISRLRRKLTFEPLSFVRNGLACTWRMQ